MSDSARDFHPGRTNAPVHIGLIPDGSRRWSVRHGVTLRAGYDHAMKHLTQILLHLFQHGTRSISVYFSSIQNFRRTPHEIAAFCESEAMACRDLLPELIERFGLDVKVAGRLDVVPSYLRTELSRLSQAGQESSMRRLGLCIAYDPFDEIEAAIQARVGHESLIKHLWISEPLDLIIRTGGSNLISNFLPLQAGFARLYFSPALFNDFSLDELQALLIEFRQLSRAYGE